MKANSENKDTLKYVYIDKIHCNPNNEQKDSKQWTFLTAYPISGMHNNVLQYIIPMSNKKFIVYNYEIYSHSKTHNWEEEHPDKIFVNMHLGFYIYNITENKWRKSSQYDRVEIGVDKRLLYPNTAIYNDKTRIFTIYDDKSKRLIQYDLENDTWNTNKYKENKIFEAPVALGVSYEGYYDGYIKYKYYKSSQQCILIGDKLHIFNHRKKNYKHCIYDMQTTNMIEINDDIEEFDNIKFDAETQIIYCKMRNCLYVLDKKGGLLNKYSISNNKWNIVDKIYIKYHKVRAMLCKREKYIVFYGGYDCDETRERSNEIFLFNVETEKMVKSACTLPTYHYLVIIDHYQSIIVNECKQIGELICGFIRLNYGKNGCVDIITNLIDLYTPNEYLYILSKVGDLYKIEINKLFDC
eukprot:198424_1